MTTTPAAPGADRFMFFPSYAGDEILTDVIRVGVVSSEPPRPFAPCCALLLTRKDSHA